VALPFHIRDFRKPDFRRLWEIDQQCFVSGIAYSQQELAYYMTRRTAFTIVAENAETKIAGFLVGQCVRIRGEQVGHIITIDILPEARRAKLGTELMSIAEKRLAEAGCGRISLEVAVDNAGAISFYQRHGYSISRTIPRYYNGELDALEMEKQLTAAG
jgi:ribosomal protein S18 acetylase RimI-like enzyme